MTNGTYCIGMEKCYIYIYIYIYIFNFSGTTGGKPKITRSSSRQFSLTDVLSGIYGYDTYQTDWISGLLSLSFSLIYSSCGSQRKIVSLILNTYYMDLRADWMWKP